MRRLTEIIDRIRYRRIQSEEASEMKVDDPSLAFGRYLFDKEND